MNIMDWVAIYGAVVATAVAALDFIKWKKDRANVTVHKMVAVSVS